MKQKLLLTFALLLMAVSGAWAQDPWWREDDVWNEDTKTLTVNSDPSIYYQDNDVIVHLIISASVVTIDGYAFDNCRNLTSVTFASGSPLMTIGNSAFKNCSSLTSITIPASVRSIGDYAFNSCGRRDFETQISVTFASGSNLTSIGNHVFSGSNLMSIEIPASVKSIGESAFFDCQILTSVTFASGSQLESIGNDSFNNCWGLSSITIPSTVTSIGNDSFKRCFSLSSVTIPASVTSIGSNAFDNCSNLTSVTVYAPSCTLGDDAFYGCNKLANIYVYSDLEDDYKDADNWKTYAGKITAIPNQGGTCGAAGHEDDVTWNLALTSTSGTLTISGTGDMADFNIGDQPWYSYRSLITSVVIGHGVTSIGDNAFYECSNVSDVTLGRGVTSIDYSVFPDCSGLTSVTLYAASCSLADGAFGVCPNLTYIYVLSDLVDTYKGAAYWSQYAGKINPIRNPDGTCGTAGHVDDVLWYLDLTSTSGVLTISGSGDMADYTSVSDQPWSYYSPFITSVVISGYVTGIGNHAFENCTNLTSVTSYVPTCALGDDAFSGCGNLAKISVFSDLVDTYKGATNWSDRASIIEAIPNQSGNCGTTVTWELVLTSTSGALTISGTGAMADYSYPEDQPWNAYGAFITSVVIGSGVTSIGENAFAGTMLTSITLPASVTSIGNDAFRYCSNLTSVTLYASSCSLGNNTAFDNCASGLQIYVFNDYVTNYQAGNWSDYYNASKITGLIGGYCGATGNGSDVIWLLTGTSSNYTLTITKVGSTGAMEDYGNPDQQPWFGFVYNITSIVIEDGVTSIGRNAFRDCYNDNLSSVTIPASVTSIGEQAFQYCYGLTSVTFASGSQLETIGAGAFDGCYGLTSITIPASVESIGSGAFDYCSGLTSITIPASVTSIGDYAFRCSNLESITVASGNSKYDSRNDCNAIIEKSTKTLVAGCKNTIIPDGADGVTSIGDYAFSSCTGLTSITIPASVTSIGSFAFGSCSSLASVTVYASTPLTLGNSYVFNNCASGLQIYVYSDLVDDFKANWSTYENKIKAISISGNCGAAGHESDVKWELALATTSGVLTITKVGSTGAMADYASASAQPWYSHAGDITSVVIEDGVTNIGDYAFSGCSNASLNITVPTSVTSVGTNAFDNVAKVTATLSETNNNTSLLAALSGVTTADLTFKRTFEALSSGEGKASTLCLPFDLDKPSTTTVGTFYTFGGVSDNTGEYVVTMTEETANTLTAGTPYMFRPATTDPPDPISFQNTAYAIPSGGIPAAGTTTDANNWEFRGTYQEITWPDGQTRLYAFAASNFKKSDDTYLNEVGAFRRFDYGHANPFRCYLWAPDPTPARGVGKAGSQLPESMKVILVSASGETTGIGTLDTRTGVVTFGDEWYSLDGRKLDGKPTKKGLYINKGKTVVIK